MTEPLTYWPRHASMRRDYPSKLPKDGTLEELAKVLTLDQIAERFGVGTNHVRDILRNRGISWIRDKAPYNMKRPPMEELMRYADQGYSAIEISEIYNVGPSTVHRWKEHYGIKLGVGAWGGPRRGKHPLTKLSDEQAAEILSLKGKVPQRELAKRYNVSYATIASIMVGRRWAGVEVATPEGPRKQYERMPMGEPFGGSGWHSWGGMYVARGEYA